MIEQISDWAFSPDFGDANFGRGMKFTSYAGLVPNW